MRGKKFITFLFEQYNISLNGITVTHAANLYYYRAFLETLLSYGNEAAESRLPNAFWYRDTGDHVVCNATEALTSSTNTDLLARYDRLKQSKEIEMVCRLHTDICNFPKHLLPGDRMQIKLTKANREFYLMSEAEDSKAGF